MSPPHHGHRLRLSLRGGRGRAFLAAGGVGAASAMLGAAVTVALGLHGGFDRAAARADLPDVIAQFDTHTLREARARIGTLPNVAAVAYRLRVPRVHVWVRGIPEITSGEVDGVMPGRRGYALVAGHDLNAKPGEAVIERGLAEQWHLAPGALIHFGTSGARQRSATAKVVGIAVAPDDVAYPLASAPRIWMPYSAVQSLFAASSAYRPVNEALIWVHDQDRLDVTLEQARAASYGIGGLTFVTRDGVRVLIDQAAGIVIALLVAFSVVALVGAGVMVAASARADVQRQLQRFAVMRALGASRRAIVTAVAGNAARRAAPAAAAGLAVGWALARTPTERLTDALDQFPRGWSMLVPLVACLLGVIGVIAAAAAWPTWQACRRPIAPSLRGGEIGTQPRGRRLPGGYLGLGMRMIASRRARSLAVTIVLAASATVVLLILALASELAALENNPAAIGKRYQLTARGSVTALRKVRALPGVAAAAQRFTSAVADSYNLGQSFLLVTYCGDRLSFEDPPLEAGRRAVQRGEAEVGVGLATALGLRPGAELAAQFSNGDEARFRVAGIVQSLDNDGRIAYVQLGENICRFRGGITVVRLAPGANRAAVAAELNRSGRPAQIVGGATPSNAAFLGDLAGLLRTVAGIDLLVCLYVVAQVLALTAHERREVVALLRACGADGADVLRLFAGAAAIIAAPAALVAIVLERLVVGPLAAGLAAPYADISLPATVPEIAIMLVGLAIVAAVASAWVCHGAMRRSITSALRAE